MSTTLLAFCCCCLLFFLPGCAGDRWQHLNGRQARDAKQSEEEWQKRRAQMVEKQLKARAIRDPVVLAAMQKVPRHRFVSAAQWHEAYSDHPLPIGHGQTISQPYIVAYMTEAAEITAQEKVLEIGTGSGYQAAILGELAKEVYSIEIIPELTTRAQQILRALGYQNVFVKTGNGWLGWPEQAPFDAILVTAAPDEIPAALIEQLAVNGRMVLPVGTDYQAMTILTKTEKGVVRKHTIPVRFVPMTGKPKQ